MSWFSCVNQLGLEKIRVYKSIVDNNSTKDANLGYY